MEPFIEEVTAQEVKRFLDPTLMITKLEYSFTTNFLPLETRLFQHTARPWYALNHSNAVWVDVPFNHYSTPSGKDLGGIADLRAGWGTLIHENLGRRFTATAAGLEVLVPTGNLLKGTGYDTWVLAPAFFAAFNPTDKFPVYVSTQYLHSLGEIGGSLADGNAELRVRSLDIEVQTVHILPKGIFIAALPAFTINFNQNFNIFSLGVGAGRALNRRFLIQGGYLHHIAGEETFSQGFQISLVYLWGKDKGSKP
jgi:hypothetical protein